MTINCVWEHNGRDTLLYAVDFVGAYTRGETLEAAVRKMQAEICSYLKWCGKKAVTSMEYRHHRRKGFRACDLATRTLMCFLKVEKATADSRRIYKVKGTCAEISAGFSCLV